MLKSYFFNETQKFGMTCSTCTKRTENLFQNIIYRLPKALLIQIKRGIQNHGEMG